METFKEIFLKVHLADYYNTVRAQPTNKEKDDCYQSPRVVNFRFWKVIAG